MAGKEKRARVLQILKKLVLDLWLLVFDKRDCNSTTKTEKEERPKAKDLISDLRSQI